MDARIIHTHVPSIKDRLESQKLHQRQWDWICYLLLKWTFLILCCAVFICVQLQSFFYVKDHFNEFNAFLMISIVFVICMLIRYVWMNAVTIKDAVIREVYYDLYKMPRGPIPRNVRYRNIIQYNNTKSCTICLGIFCVLCKPYESILKCGHRFHSICLWRWEVTQYDRNENQPFQCPTCIQTYNWKDKWHYDYGVSIEL